MAHFPIFGQKDIFQKIWPCHAQQHMDPKHSAEFQKNLMSQKKEKLWTEGQKDGQTLIHRTLPAMAWGPKMICEFY